MYVPEQKGKEVALTNSKYAWFGATNVASTLVGVAPVNRLIDDAGAITALGTQYRNGGLL